jgi:molybdenum cofactor guanylyltransferase
LRDFEFPLLETEGQAVDPFFDVNMPDDLAKAARLLQSI